MSITVTEPDEFMFLEGPDSPCAKAAEDDTPVFFALLFPCFAITDDQQSLAFTTAKHVDDRVGLVIVDALMAQDDVSWGIGLLMRGGVKMAAIMARVADVETFTGIIGHALNSSQIVRHD